MKSKCKLIWFCVSTFLCVSNMTAQSLDQNFVSVYRNTSPSTTVVEHQYLDGLGRLIEKVSVNMSPYKGVDLVETINYDSFGRVSKKSKKVSVSNNDGKYYNLKQSDYVTDYNESFAFTEYYYENTPLGRQTMERGPGSAWIMQSKGQNNEYLCNSSSPHLKCLNFIYEDDAIINNSYYPEGVLRVLKTKDEDGRLTFEFKDSEDKLILTRKVMDGTDVDTYFVYDVEGDLCAVLPPAAVVQLMASGSYSCKSFDALLKYAYLYVYDYRHRCISKKFPGVDAIYIKYDEADRPVFQQTGVQRLLNSFTMMNYDGFGRLVYQTDGKLTVKNYYDFYDSIPPIASLAYVAKAGYGVKASNVKTLQTGSAVTTDAGDFLYTVFYYDIKGQLIQKRSQNMLGGYDAYYYFRTYTGNVGKMLHEHVAGGFKLAEIVYYDYDNADRLTEVRHQFKGGPIVMLSHNAYDRVCRLKSQNVFNREVVTYTYNVKDWLTRISSTNFSEILNYNDGNNKQYGGNISAMSWCTASNSLNRKYDFSYDELSRLLSASYSEDGSFNGHYDASYSYDLMGNMLSLRRKGLQDGGAFGEMDNVSFVYNGNQLIKADNRIESPTYKDAWNFIDDASASIEYEYDANGNLTKDMNKGICKVEYNSLGLPTCILFSNGKSIRYVYDAVGKKLRAIYHTTLPSTELILDYCENMIYENGELKQVLVDGGYITFVNEKVVYHYYLKDHLGSNRVVVNYDSGEVEQVNHYYPYGGLMAESIGGNVQCFKYNGKELDRMHGLDWFNYGARWYDGIRLLTQDRYSEKNMDVSPYSYCSCNPLNSIDINGDSTVVLHLLGGVGHLGLLVQNEMGRWQYFSMNGTWIYDATNGMAGGKPYNDMGTQTFDSPEAFLNSEYNRKGSDLEIKNDEVNGYGYEEAYVLPTDPKQDSSIKKAFVQRAERGYNLLINQCAQVVQGSLKAAGISLFDDNYVMHIGGQKVSIPSTPYTPQATFSILQKKYKGKLITRKRKR